MNTGSEYHLLTTAIQAGLFHSPNYRNVQFKELALPSGLPDLVLVSFHKSQINKVREMRRAGLNDTEIRIFYLINQLNTANVDVLVKYSTHSTKLLRTVIEVLLDRNMLLMKKSNEIALNRKVKYFLASKIIAVEAKISDWRKAIFQAVSNKWFSSESYILMPPKRNINTICRTAKSYGVGVITYDSKAEGNPTIVEPSPVYDLPSSYGSWLVHERAVNRLSIN